MKVGIMQPYFFPYIGYFQLMTAVDEFILYDNVKFTKKGWFNRNRILINNNEFYTTVPLRKDSSFLNIKDRYLAAGWSGERLKMLKRIKEAYRKAPHFEAVYPLIEKCIFFEEDNLFNFIFNSLTHIKQYLDIRTPFIVSSEIPIDHSLKAEKKIIAICKARNAETYVNPIGGIRLYLKSEFEHEGIDLYFLKTINFEYRQFNNNFVPWLLIIDIMMHCSIEKTKKYLNNYQLQ
jgi:hypothetical protein